MFSKADIEKSVQKKIKNPDPTTLNWGAVFPGMKEGKTSVKQFMGETHIKSIAQVQQAFVKKAATLAVDNMNASDKAAMLAFLNVDEKHLVARIASILYELYIRCANKDGFMDSFTAYPTGGWINILKDGAYKDIIDAKVASLVKDKVKRAAKAASGKVLLEKFNQMSVADVAGEAGEAGADDSVMDE